MLCPKPIAALNDNYIWHLSKDNYSLVVDPGDAQAVLDKLGNQQLIAILITHHHWDHTNGVNALKQKFPNATVYGPKNCPFSHIDVELSEGMQIKIDTLNVCFNILHVPGHTLDHIAYYNHQFLFCGDTLFSIGCGRMFEGTPAIYVESLNKLKSLSKDLLVCCTHEYTQTNISFALSIQPDHQELLDLQNKVEQLRREKRPSLPVLLADELKLNPFLRTDCAEMQKSVSNIIGTPVNTSIQTFAALRKLKDNF
ncbi:hydroxyacylglutathione hydrolase [Catenovulum sediminis]|uniref:Hydroxyacylglutathione hydrolase n=1 Tax=Catenovulum sediminis TaxID=1740262 RepID=A0ABV1RC11_9ALTE|nr:hydroxyacylglutathione hydrolase [Catenovulum sediminis]